MSNTIHQQPPPPTPTPTPSNSQAQVSALSALLRNNPATPTPSRPSSRTGTPITSPVVGNAQPGHGGGWDGGKLEVGSEGSQVGARPINGSHPTDPAPAFPSQLSPYAQPFLPSGSYMGMNISGTSFAPMSYIGASYTGRGGQPGMIGSGSGGGGGVSGGMSVSPGGWSVGMGGFVGPSGGSSVSAKPMGINGMAPAQRAYPHQAYHPQQAQQQQQLQPMNSFGNMGSYLGRGSLNIASGGFSLSNSGFGLPYGASLTHPTQVPHAASSSVSSHQGGANPAGPVGGAGMSVGAFVPPGMGGTGGERSRELEAKFVKDFMCCGLRLNGLHDLLEHYEEHHVHLAGDLRQQTQSMMSLGQDPTLQPSTINGPGSGGVANTSLNGGVSGAVGLVGGSGRNTPNAQNSRSQQGPIPGSSFPNAASSSYTVPPIPGNPPPGIVAALAAGNVPPGGLRTAGGVTSMMGAAPGLTKGSSSTDSGDAPGTPGMMDIDMQMDDDDEPPVMGGADMGMGMGGVGSSGGMSGMAMGGGFGGALGISNGIVNIGGQQQGLAGQDAYYKGPPLQFVQPSMLSYTIPPPSASTAATPANHMAFNGAGQGAIGRVPRPGGNLNTGGGASGSHHSSHHPSHVSVGTTGGSGSGGHHLTEAQKAERAARKAARKEAKRIARENGEAESSDDGRDAEGFKKYRCPVEGCNKSYKQANGLKYHLNRSINSSHGHLAGMPIVPHNPSA